MQLLTNYSEEGELPGLALIDGETKKFRFSNNELKVPHMGWNILHFRNKSLLTEGMSASEQKFYFVHSYYVQCKNENVIATATHGIEFASIIQSGNVFGAQFHPEKSHKFGMQLFKNFARI